MIESPINKTLFFDKPTHAYTNLAGEKLISVSTLVHKFTKPFDEDGAIKKRIAERDGVTEKELTEKWRKTNEDACIYGTKVHSEIEYFVKNKKIDKKGEYKKIVKEFAKLDFEGELQSELILMSEDNRLAGTLDLVEVLEGRVVRLFDIKSNKKLNKYDPFGNRMLPPFNYYYSHTFQLYTFQLNLYAYLLEEAGYWVEDMTILYVNPKSLKIEIHPVPFLRPDCLKMLSYAKKYALDLPEVKS